MRSMKVLCSVALVLGLASSAVASYGTINLNYLGQVSGHSMGVGGRFDFNIVDDSLLTLPPGFALEKIDSPNEGGSAVDDIATFCIQLTAGIASGPYSADIYSGPNAAKVDELGDKYWSLAAYSGDSTDAGAFQIALWELVVGDGNTGTVLPGGNGPTASGSISAAAKTLAQTWLNSLTGVDVNPGLQMVALTSGLQDQITQIAVPEAATLLVWSFVCGAVGMTVYRRRRNA